MTCQTCTRWQPKRSGEMARHLLCRCAHGEAWRYYPPHHTCPRHAAVSADVAQARQAWIDKSTTKGATAVNCKPGDLAVIVRISPLVPQLTGRIVEVLEAPPVGVEFQLPDGKMHLPIKHAGEWIIRFCHPTDLSAVRGRSGALYACCHDSALRPIRDPGEDARDEMLRSLPQEVTA